MIPVYLSFVLIELALWVTWQFSNNLDSNIAEITAAHNVLIIPVLFTTWTNFRRGKKWVPYAFTLIGIFLSFIFWATSFKTSTSAKWYSNIIYPDSETTLLIGVELLIAVFVVVLNSILIWFFRRRKNLSRAKIL